MWRLHWRRAIFYSAITKRQHVSPPCVCVFVRACARYYTHVCAYLYYVALRYLLTDQLFADNDNVRRR